MRPLPLRPFALLLSFAVSWTVLSGPPQARAQGSFPAPLVEARPALAGCEWAGEDRIDEGSPARRLAAIQVTLGRMLDAPTLRSTTRDLAETLARRARAEAASGLADDAAWSCAEARILAALPGDRLEPSELDCDPEPNPDGTIALPGNGVSPEVRIASRSLRTPRRGRGSGLVVVQAVIDRSAPPSTGSVPRASNQGPATASRSRSTTT